MTQGGKRKPTNNRTADPKGNSQDLRKPEDGYLEYKYLVFVDFGVTVLGQALGKDHGQKLIGIFLDWRPCVEKIKREAAQSFKWANVRRVHVCKVQTMTFAIEREDG